MSKRWREVLVGFSPVFAMFLFALFMLAFCATPAPACEFKFCGENKSKSATTRDIRTDWNRGRIKVGDIYDPGTGRIQIRNNSRQIIGYIEGDGDVTNIYRQKIGTIDD